MKTTKVWKWVFAMKGIWICRGKWQQYRSISLFPCLPAICMNMLLKQHKLQVVSHHQMDSSLWIYSYKIFNLICKPNWIYSPNDYAQPWQKYGTVLPYPFRWKRAVSTSHLEPHMVKQKSENHENTFISQGFTFEINAV